MHSTMNVTIQSEILSSVHENTQKMKEMSNNMNSLKDTVQFMQTEMTNNVLLKFNDLKQNYYQDLRTLIKENTNEDIRSLLEKINLQFINKTSIVINEIIPNIQTHCYSQIHDSIRSFHKSISDDTRVLLKYVDNNSVKDYINHFEMKSSIMLQNLQQPIYTFITASEERINQNINHIKDSSNHSTNIQEKLVGELTQLIHQLRDIPMNNESHHNTSSNSNTNTMNILLNKLYNTSEIVLLKKGSPSSSNENTFFIKIKYSKS